MTNTEKVNATNELDGTRQDGFVPTRLGTVAYTELRPDHDVDAVPLLFVHGASSSRRIFRHQLSADFGPRRVIAIDLLGHGDSDDASDPDQAYTPAGFAATTVEAMRALDVSSVIVVGWSLGGYIGLEMLHRFPVAAVMTTGTPPVNQHTMVEGFLDSEAFSYAGVADLTAEQAATLADLVTSVPAPDGVLDDLLRTDKRARPILFAGAASGNEADKRHIVMTTEIPLAIVDGVGDPIVNREHVDAIAFTSSLWRSAPIVLDGTGHAPFLDKPEVYNALLREFLADHAL